jgi:hypothetical protein
MRKITKLARKAFLNAVPFKLDNTEVKVTTGEFGSIITEMVLFGNIIARQYTISESGDDFRIIAITSAGHKTNTTKERLSALPFADLHQKDFKWYLNGELWDGKWKVIHAGILI